MSENINQTSSGHSIIAWLQDRYGPALMGEQQTVDAIPTVWVSRTQVVRVLAALKETCPQPYAMLYDLVH